MKTLRLPLPIPLAMRPSALSAGLLLLVPVSAQEPQAEPAAPPVEISGEVRLLGKIADGTPALPAPPPVLPQFVVRKAITRHLPDRKVTVRLVDNPGLPPLPMKVEFDAEAFERWSQTPEGMEILGKARERANKNRFVILSGRIYENRGTLLRWWIPGNEQAGTLPKSFEAWSNINFLHLGGLGAFEYEGIQYSLLFALGKARPITQDAWPEVSAELGVAEALLSHPGITDDAPWFAVTRGDENDAEGLAMMDGIHVLYSQERDALIEAFEKRERARILRDAYLKAHPSRPKNLVLSYWSGDTVPQLPQAPAEPAK